VPLVTAGASIALVAHALALVLTRAPADPSVGAALGAALVLLLALVHFAARTHGAALGPGVVAGQVRQWLVVALAGFASAVALSVVATWLGPVLFGPSLPIVIVTGVLGAVLTAAGLIALLTSRQSE
jgi:hypothetical protein